MKAEKEKGDLMTRLHRVEGENINLRIEQDMMKQRPYVLLIHNELTEEEKE